MSTRVQFRRGAAAEWADADTILAEGEPGYDKDSGRTKIGDGTTPWSQLPFDGDGVFVAVTEKGVPNGVATLDNGGKLPTSLIGPDIARTADLAAAGISEAEMNAAIVAALVDYITEGEVDTKLANLIASAPAALNTLNELATALGNDPNFATTITTLIGTKLAAATRGAANGVAALDSGGKVPAAQLPSITAAMVAADLATQAELDAAVALLIPLAQKAAANGVASLDGTGKVPSAQLPTITTYPTSTLFYESGSGAAAATLTGVAPDFGAVYGAPISTDAALQRTAGGLISGSAGGNGAKSQLLGLTKADDFWFHSKMVRSTANPLLLIFRYQDANNYWYLQVVPTGFQLYQRTGGTNTLILDITYAWTDNDDIGVIVFAGSGNKRDMAITVNGVVLQYVYTDIQNSSTGFALKLGADWGQTFDNVTIETVPARLQDAYEATRVVANNQTGTAYTLASADSGKVVELNNAATVTVTVPADSATFNPPIGTVIELWQQGAGQVVVAPAAGVTIRSTGGNLKLYGQYASASLRRRAPNEWVLVGDLVA